MSDSHRLPHVQGLRGVSVLLIILFHAGFIFQGGFVGVDIFFVISGFVIMRMLLREKISNELGINWKNFFYNRARRLIPSLSIVTIVTFISVVLTFDEAERFAAANEVFPVMFFWSNAFFFLKNDYLALNADVFTHMWSLAVEEQFYLLIPVVFALARIVKKIFNVEEKHAILFVFTSQIVASFVISMLLTNFSSAIGVPKYLLPERFGFFATPARIWEILLGAIGSLIIFRTERQSKFVNMFAYCGLLGIICSALFLDSWMKFPGINAVPAVLASLTLIIYGNRVAFTSKLLNFRPLIWIGEISYNLYLVHWPILVIMKHQFGSNSTIRFAAMLFSFPLAKGLYSRVDQPFRRLSEINRKTTLIGLVVLVVAPILFAVTYLKVAPRVDLKVTVTSNLLPYYSLGSNMCVDVPISDFDRNKCISGSLISGRKLLVVGDSHAASISEAVISAYLKVNPGGSVLVWSKSGCPFLTDDNSNRICDINRDFIMNLIEVEKPSEIVISNAVTRYLGIENLNDLPRGLQSKLEVVGSSYERTFSFLNQIEVPVYIVHEVPKLDPMLHQRVIRLSKVQLSLIKTLENSAIRYRNIEFADLADIICPNMVCSRIVNGEEIYLNGDPEHLTAQGSLIFIKQFEVLFFGHSQ